MMKFVVVVLLLFLSFADAQPAEAAFCRNSDQGVICILDIQRSAKNYWEYRAVVSVDGVKQPLQVYNCRDRVRIAKDGRIIRFQPQGAGELICQVFKKLGRG